MKRCLILLMALLFLFSGCSESPASTASALAAEESDSWGDDFFGWTTAGSIPSAVRANNAAQFQHYDGSAVLEEDTPVILGNITEDAICSYLQGSGSYEKGVDWSGDWCYIDAGGGRLFNSFGCGLCCLTNMYCTLTGNSCTPGDMFYYAKAASSYSPGPGGGAIDWDAIDQLCTSFGFGGTLCVKPEDYSVFQQDMASATTIMVLVSSYEDEAIWQNLPGHYVNLWLYNPEDDTVFLSDSRGPATNRTRVSLYDVYRALYTSDEYQYYLIA